MEIKVIKRDYNPFNHTALVEVDGEILATIRQGSLHIWAFAGRLEKSREWLKEFDAKMNLMLKEANE